MKQKVVTIHLPRNERNRQVGGRVRLTPQIVKTLKVVGEQFECPDLRITREGLGVYVEDWDSTI